MKVVVWFMVIGLWLSAVSFAIDGLATIHPGFGKLGTAAFIGFLAYGFYRLADSEDWL